MSNEWASPLKSSVNFDSVFNSFSRRTMAKDLPEIPESTKSRILQYWRHKFGDSLVSGDVFQAFWAEILPILQMRAGTPLIHQNLGGLPSPPRPEHALRYVLEGETQHFLDFLEDLFRVPMFQQMNLDANP